ncbi:MAG: hypothetical protein ACRDNS_24585 [Trebonia sp.]
MPWNYSGDPSSADRDAVRFEIGDTVASAPLLADAEIEWCILNETGQAAALPAVLDMQQVFYAAARCMEALSGQFAAQADTQVGQLRLTYSSQAKNYVARAKQLRDRAAGMSGPYAGGQSISEKQAARDNTDLPQPMFRRREWTNPFAHGVPGLPDPWER